MELQLKDRLLRRGRFEIISNIEKTVLKITRRFSSRSSDLTNIGLIPYETTKEYRTNMIELEYKKAQALAETYVIRNRMI